VGYPPPWLQQEWFNAARHLALKGADGQVRSIESFFNILGSASGFTSNEPCTGLALCDNGDYILIDSIPYLDKHLFARGISKNQVKAVVITHLHDDHCALFPLIQMPEKVEILTTRAMYEMAMEKLSCHMNCDSRHHCRFFVQKK